MSELFEKASRLKLRFSTDKGSLTVEDLWDLQLTSTKGALNLDDLARALHKQVKETADELSFVKPVESAGNEVLALKFEIVKHVITVKVGERDAAAAARVKAEQKQRALAIVAKRQDAALDNASDEELQKIINGM
jgi:hypothetical protein